MTRRGPTVGDVGERALIARIERVLGPAPRGTLGIGDDTALVPSRRGPTLLTTDVQIERTHFLRGLATPEEVGWKALAVNVSDVAGMGGRPEAAVVSLVVPPGLALRAVERLYRGMKRMARRSGVAVVGGNVARGEAISITVLLTGALVGRRAVRRGGACPGDRLFVTGQPGLADLGRRLLEAAAGRRGDLWSLGAAGSRARAAAIEQWLHRTARDARGGIASPRAAATAIRRFLTPDPRDPIVRELLRFGPTALIDTSDGLARDLSHLANDGGAPLVSGEALPRPRTFAALAVALGRDPIVAALQGGEDYDLLFTLAPAAAARLRARGRLKGVPVHEIGVFEAGLRSAALRGAGAPLREETDWHFPG